ncbi:unnamed protein product [Paramecium sonneborni]|uniref:Uncharacterized protein n=1 Tax=Paramecium sonneborni TaxID=65129 RepID=A0A8S1RRA2_9CILI|nr:unnamed protein product [Paramecium sonneborni]
MREDNQVRMKIHHNNLIILKYLSFNLLNRQNKKIRIFINKLKKKKMLILSKFGFEVILDFNGQQACVDIQNIKNVVTGVISNFSLNRLLDAYSKGMLSYLEFILLVQLFLQILMILKIVQKQE